MIIANSILLGLVALICFSGGINLMLKGTKHYLPGGTAPQLILDNLFRFLSGIYFGSGFMLAYAAFNTDKLGNIVYFFGIIVLFSGLGRLYSRLKVGSAGKYFDIIMIVEMILGLAIMFLKWLS